MNYKQFHTATNKNRTDCHSPAVLWSLTWRGQIILRGVNYSLCRAKMNELRHTHSKQYFKIERHY